MIVHDPKRFENGALVEAPVSQLDVLPTVADLLGYEIEGGAYQGSSLLGPPPEDRLLHFSCWGSEECLGSIERYEKYIYYYDNQPDELYDLSEDPLERKNLAGERQEDAQKRRGELLEWHSMINATYRGPQRE